jgi:hypothetical protein
VRPIEKQTGIGGAEITMVLNIVVLNIEWTTSTRLTRTPRPAIYERLHWISRPPAESGTRASRDIGEGGYRTPGLFLQR